MNKFARAIGAFFISSVLSGIIGGTVFIFYVLITSVFVKWHSEADATEIVLAVGCVLEGLLTVFVAAILVLFTSVLPVRYFETYRATDLSRAFLPLMLVIYMPVFVFSYMLFKSIAMVAYLSVPYLFSVTLTLYYFNKHMVEGYILTRVSNTDTANEPITA